MIPLIIFICMAVLVVVAIEIRERHKAANPQKGRETADVTVQGRPEGCCGEHLVCERETLLSSKPEIVYYDDEELDALAGIEPETFTTEQHEMISNIFFTLKEEDVAGWCRSLQLREIELPQDIREQALLIVKEQRAASVTGSTQSHL